MSIGKTPGTLAVPTIGGPGLGGRAPGLPAASSQTVDLTATDISFEGLRGVEPLLLLPVRIETRFADVTTGAQLWVRIFPDQFAIDSHDPNLTADEWAGAQQYWTAMWTLTPSQTDQQKQAWADLAAAFGPRRAAYVASSTGPADFDTWVSGPPSVVLGTGRTFPTPPGTLRPSSWSQPAVARALPTQWFVILTAGTSTQVIEVIRPQNDLVVSPDPGATSPLGSAGGPTDSMSWLSDFAKAQTLGMAVTINITAAQRTTGFDQVVVFGITGDFGSAGQTIVENLLTAHRFTDGLAFVPQGTATKNSTDSISGYTRSDPTFADSFAAERAGALIPTTAVTLNELETASSTDGRMFAGALGLDPAYVAHTDYADQSDQQDAAAMATAAWPATGDYFLRLMMGISVTPAVREEIRKFATLSLRGRGPIPALRLGTTPYGILPIVALASASGRAGGLNPIGGLVATLVQKARGIWEGRVNAFPIQVMPASGSTPEQALANVLGRDATTVTVNGRLDTGPWLAWNIAQWDIVAGSLSFPNWFGNVPQSSLYNTGENILNSVNSALKQSAAQAAALGWPTLLGPASGILFLANLGSNLPHVTVDGQVSEEAGLPKTHFLTRHIGKHPVVRRVNVLEFMCNLNVTTLLSFAPASDDLTLLSAVVRQALLLEYATAAAQVLNQGLIDPEMWAQSPAQTSGTLLWALEQTTYIPPAGLPAASGTLGDYIYTQVQTTAGRNAFPSVAALLDAVSYLSTLSTAKLDRILIESLDVCGYRLDAWATAVATNILLSNRAKAALGVSLGVWGYVEDLRPAAKGTLSADDLAAIAAATGSTVPGTAPPFAPAKDTTGFIFAPSLTHAATGAILRNGYLSHALGTYGSAFAIDLSSARVRAALMLMEGMRQGQPLGALLGYLFEQGLNAAGLQILLQPFRNTYPIVANKMTQYASGPADAVAASNVVDGAALQGAWEAGTIPWGQGGLPASSGDPNYPVVTGLLDMLSDRVDALSDIAVAESIYQVAKGNPARSGGALNASSREQHPPEPQVVETPRSGLDLTQRLLSTFAVTPGAPPSSTWLGAAPSTPRASAEPWLEQWLDTILPAPNNVQFRLTYTPPAGGASATSGVLTLAGMGLSALDLLSLAPPPPSGAAAAVLDGSDLAGSDLDRWILAECLVSGSLPAGATTPAVIYVPTTPLAAPLMTIPQLLTLVRSLQELIGAARPLTPADFVSPAAVFPDADLDLSGVATRLSAAATALLALNTNFTGLLTGLPNPLNAANGDSLSAMLMSAASFGFPGAAPATTGRDSASLTVLQAQATTISAAVAQRVNALTGDATLYNSTTKTLVLQTSPAPTVKLAEDTAQAIFGPKFMVLTVITPTTTGTTTDPVNTAVTNLATAVSAWGSAGHLPAATVLQQLTHVRPPAARLDEVVSLSAVLTGNPVADLAVAQLGGQLPFSAANPWLGAGPVSSVFPLAVGTKTTQSLLGSYALLVWTPPALGSTTGASMCGLLFDEWIEQIPFSAEKTAIALHYSEPGARAPQSLLLAIAPPTQDNWSARLVRDAVLEAVALAKIRTVDPQTLELGGQVGQLLPALFAGFGPFTVSTIIPQLPTLIDPVGS